MKIKLDKEIDRVNDWSFAPELPTNIQESMCLETLSSMNFVYKKVRNKYKLFCPNCNDYTLYTNEELDHIKKSCVCPKCREERYSVIDNSVYNNKSTKVWNFVRFGAYGYEIDCDWKWNTEPKFFIKKVFKNLKGKYWIRGIYTTGYWNGSVKPYYCYSNQNEHRKNDWHITTCQDYRGTFEKEFKFYKPKTKKENLDKYAHLNLKSNQIKMILDYPVSKAQIYAIKLYDFKNIEDVYKYRKFIDQSKYSIIDTVEHNNETFNITTIQYLRKNKINVSDYVDYAKACKQVNRKVDKPKDFKLWHDRITQLVEVSKNEKYRKGCEKQWKRLKKNIYQKKDITIRPFEDIEEIVYVSTALHNCMSRMYLDKYALNKTELYHLDINGVPTLAIEIKDNKLIQCRADNNANPSPELKKIVKKWQMALC